MDHESLEYFFNQNKLNMRQRRGLELFKDYNYSIKYHHHKDNIMVYALSRKSSGSSGALHRPLLI